jgi:hypothetical protein
MVRPADHRRTGRDRARDQPPHGHPPSDPTWPRQNPVHRRWPRQQPQARKDHRSLDEAHRDARPDQDKPGLRAEDLGSPPRSRRPGQRGGPGHECDQASEATTVDEPVPFCNAEGITQIDSQPASAAAMTAAVRRNRRASSRGAATARTGRRGPSACSGLVELCRKYSPLRGEVAEQQDRQNAEHLMIIRSGHLDRRTWQAAPRRSSLPGQPQIGDGPGRAGWP